MGNAERFLPTANDQRPTTNDCLGGVVMPMSAYDRWKTTPPAYLPQTGDCLQCGSATEWISGRLLIARKVRALPNTAKRDRHQLLTALKKRIRPEQYFCAACESDAIRAKLDPCDCGAMTAWGCVCP
jgi:hypothetical protein